MTGPAENWWESFFDETYAYFTIAPSLSAPRYLQTATLTGGDLLLAGGLGCCAALASSDEFTVPLLHTTPTSGPPGQAITLTGSGYDAGEPVAVTMDGRPIGSATTGGYGTFTLSTAVPIEAPA